MISRIITELGPWSWWVLGMLLLAAELTMPGVFLVWVGLGALLTGVLSLLFWEMGFWTWHVQALVFALSAVTFTLTGRRYFASRDKASDQPLLNQRSASLVGRTATLGEPIREGRGRIRLDDTFWSVSGPDLPEGTRVRVISGKGGDLTVEKA
ncbi:NfeD family protein [Rhizobium sp. G187]|uniref:NfeD family protein n=1 Tax=Rhizobium sp. G187 TaxID=3451352 RepID=UPI003EE7E704